jgi:hypothetical protein
MVWCSILLYRVLDHLKNYSMKALVNVVDYLSTVAYKLNDLLVQQTTHVSAADLQTAALAQVNSWSPYIFQKINYVSVKHSIMYRITCGRACVL